MEEFYFISFESTNNAMQAEDFLKKNNYNVTIIPTPREVTQSCGLSIKLNEGRIDEVVDFKSKGLIKIKGMYHLQKENGLRKISKID